MNTAYSQVSTDDMAEGNGRIQLRNVRSPFGTTSAGYRSDRSDTLSSVDEDDFLLKKQSVPFYTVWWRRCSNLPRLMDQCCYNIFKRCRKEKEYYSRTVYIGNRAASFNNQQGGNQYPSNVIRNQKYTILTFLPLVLFQQFKFFLNFYFLVMACTQFIPEIRVGYLYTYWGPLGFVIFVTMCREALDDFRRYKRDKEVNTKLYKKLAVYGGETFLSSSDIRVGDLITVEKNQRVPADMVFLQTTEPTGSCFIRTDQLDGETDWKLKVSVPVTQGLSDSELLDIDAEVFAEKPSKQINSFVGVFERKDDPQQEMSLNIENVLWANTVVASGQATGIVVYTGAETRAVMNTTPPKSKVGRLDREVNMLSKVLFLAVLILSLVMLCLKGFDGPWYRYLIRFVLLFSYIIPLSLRVNLDMGKIVYSVKIQRDKHIEGTVVRSTTLPEELGRVQYLLTDKTGTLTMNEMVFKKLHLGTVAYGADTMDEIVAHLQTAYSTNKASSTSSNLKIRKTAVTRVTEAVKAIALCHNVTPVYEDDASVVTYQASSPDEVALVKWTESVGLSLVERQINSLTIKAPVTGANHKYKILQIFPFTSESKRMGIIVQSEETGEITFYMKGADVIMKTIVTYNDWLEEESDNMAREGLRTLVVAKKILSLEQYKEFETNYHKAKMQVQERDIKVASVVNSLERDMELLCLTGVEDKLQDNVRSTLELLRNANIKIWMLTGDKLDTAICIAKSSKLVSKVQELHVFQSVTTRTEAHKELNNFRRKNNAALIIQGSSLETCLEFYSSEFVELACQSPAVVVCRCSPTQKAAIVTLLKTYTKKCTCAIGDGGNDVSMIQAAHVGLGIVGKEGKQASLAADFSLNQFSFLGRLLMVHGRRSYKSSASLSQFVMHRGLIVSTMQAVFSSIFYFASVPLFPGFLLVGYATVYTMFPVFSLTLDKDVSADIAMTYPELYQEMTLGRSFNLKSFFVWVAISIYQGGIIMYGALVLFDQDFVHIISITFTALLITELLMVALTIRTWHWIMVVAELFSIAAYIASLFILKSFFDTAFLQTFSFIWKTVVITAVSCIPLYVIKFLQRKFSPATYSKVKESH